MTFEVKEKKKIELGTRETGRDAKMEIRRDRQTFVDIEIERDRIGYTRDREGYKTADEKR